MDRNNRKYLLNPTNVDKSNFSDGIYFPFVVDFFHDKLKSNVVRVNGYKNTEGKVIIPFPISYDIDQEEIKFLKSNTSIDYIILSKIEYLENIDKNNLTALNKKRLYSAKVGAISFLKILDIKNNQVLIEMTCTADININENIDMDSGIRELQPITIHKNSYVLGEKAMKKLLKKIK
ncbi:hypothetical protein [Polaribacter sp.]|uniref:hypothetical protein n=3 Tax=Polaribacter sp. TaxID=1920175 RepID=UPI004048673A